ncbi:unnamed protein product, partial [Rotaria magnacalcarata]
MGKTKIPFETEHTVLAMTLDSPRLTWGKHIKKLKTDCLSRLQTLKAVSGTSWGADRKTLKIFYNSFVLSKLNYGSILYESARIIVALQHVPAHCGVRGNEIVDAAAKMAYRNDKSALLPIELADQKFHSKQATREQFQEYWEIQRHGIYLGTIKDSVDNWP